MTRTSMIKTTTNCQIQWFEFGCSEEKLYMIAYSWNFLQFIQTCRGRYRIFYKQILHYIFLLCSSLVLDVQDIIGPTQKLSSDIGDFVQAVSTFSICNLLRSACNDKVLIYFVYMFLSIHRQNTVVCSLHISATRACMPW